MVQRVRTAAAVLPGNFLKIQSQDLSSFLYASKRCSSTGSHGIFILVLEPCFFLLEHASSSLLRSGSLLLKRLSSSLLDGSLPSDSRALASTALLCWSVVEGALSKTRFASTVDDKIVPLKSGDEVCRLRPVKRNECCSIGLMVKSSIFPTWPMLSMSRASWLKETPHPSRPSRITAVKEQQCVECGRNVTLVSVGKISLDDRPRL
jgi:hypothetical protein